MFAEIAELLLGTAVEALENPPTRHLVLPGRDNAWDCEMVYVQMAGGQAVARDNACPSYLDVVFQVGVLRCVTVQDRQGRAPTAEQITSDGLIHLDDAEALFKAFACLKIEHPAVARNSVGSSNHLGPTGAMSGVEWGVNVRLTV